MNIDAFLAPLDATNPSGAELRNDARFHALERRLDAASREMRLKSLAEGGSGAVALDWAALLDECRSLAEAGRDLRLLVIVARGLANDGGFAGLASGLDLLARTVTLHWPNLHPALRESPSRRDAALRRINALYQIENTENGLLGDLEFNILLSPRGIGAVSGADMAAGALSRNTFLNEAPKGLNEKEMADLLARHEARAKRAATACTATATENPALLGTLVADVAAAQASLGALEAALEPLVSENNVTVKFTKLAQFLARIAQTLSAAGPGAAQAEAPPMSADAPPATAALTPAFTPGRIGSRREVEACLDQIIDFYERTEPSSPIPHLARRMRKMVPMNFLQLMEEVAPGGMKEFRSIAGIIEEKAK